MAARTAAIYPANSDNAPSGYDATYTTMSLMETGEDGDLTGANELEVSITENAGENGDWEAQGIDDDETSFTGWTTDAAHDITITTLNDGARNMYTDGKWSTSAYRKENGGDTQTPIRINNTNRIDVTFDGLQIKYTGGENVQPLFTRIGAASSTVIIKNSYLWDDGAGSSRAFYSLDANITTWLINCILLASGDVLYIAGGVVKLYNCTITLGGGAGIETDNNDVIAINCAVFNTANDFKDTFTTIDYCASDDVDGTNPVDISPANGTEADKWALAFTDYANGDFRIKDVDSVLYQAGLDHSTDANVPTIDIAGNARVDGSESIGAFEYPVVAGRIMSSLVSAGGLAGMGGIAGQGGGLAG